MSKRNWFDPKIGFLDLTIVKFTYRAFIAVAILFLIVIVAGEYNQWRPGLGLLAVNNFFDLVKVPLGCISALIPILAVFGFHHRSMQTAEQNRMTNYYAHQDAFISFIEQNFDKEQVNPRRLHNHIYDPVTLNYKTTVYELISILEIYHYQHCAHLRECIRSFISTKELNKKVVCHDLNDGWFSVDVDELLFSTNLHSRTASEVDVSAFITRFKDAGIYTRCFSVPSEQERLRGWDRILIKFLPNDTLFRYDLDRILFYQRKLNAIFKEVNDFQSFDDDVMKGYCIQDSKTTSFRSSYLFAVNSREKNAKLIDANIKILKSKQAKFLSEQ